MSTKGIRTQFQCDMGGGVGRLNILAKWTIPAYGFNLKSCEGWISSRKELHRGIQPYKIRLRKPQSPERCKAKRDCLCVLHKRFQFSFFKHRGGFYLGELSLGYSILFEVRITFLSNAEIESSAQDFPTSPGLYRNDFITFNQQPSLLNLRLLFFCPLKSEMLKWRSFPRGGCLSDHRPAQKISKTSNYEPNPVLDWCSKTDRRSPFVRVFTKTTVPLILPCIAWVPSRTGHKNQSRASAQRGIPGSSLLLA